MTTGALEERLMAMEREIAELRTRLEQPAAPKGNPWLDQIFGSFAGSEGHEEAVRLGREYRESQRMEYDEEAE